MTTGEVGIALGGGGPVGVAWEIGAVVGLAQAASFHANRASVIVGTSAGSIVGTLIRQGRTPEDLVAWLDRVGPTPPPEPDMRVLGAVFELMAGEGLPTEEELRTVAGLALSARTQPVEPFIDAIGTSLGGREWPQLMAKPSCYDLRESRCSAFATASLAPSSSSSPPPLFSLSIRS